MRSFHVCIALALAALLLGACAGDSTGPTVVAGYQYVLRDVDGDTLPAVLGVFGSQARIALADTLWFETTGLGRHVAVFRQRAADGTEGPADRLESSFLYHQQGNEVFLEFACPDPIPGSVIGCTAPPQMRGTVSGSVLRLSAAYSFRTPLHYRRR